MPLEQLAELLTAERQIPVLLDKVALQDAGLDGSAPISCAPHDLPLASALRLALEPLGLTFVVQDEVLLITNVDAASTKLVTCVYPVLDLVQVYQPGGAAALELDGLVETITTTIDPDTWDEVGGEGSIVALVRNATLVISQTQQVQDSTKSLLARLRDARREQQLPLWRPPDPAEMLTRVYTLKDNEIPADDLVQIIVGTVEPPAWGNAPGAFIRATNGRLVVLQQRGVHAQIERFLRELGVSK